MLRPGRLTVRNLRLPVVLVLAITMLWAGNANSVAARNYALLVGVSSYPALDPKYQLAGPDNDVRLMQKVLRQLKVEDRDIVALYSSGPKKPTRANIIAALRSLAEQTGANDFVYLHFGGHGSRQPARAGDAEEEDNLDEIFLPEDVGSWNKEIGAVERAITDNEINEMITAIRANGTFVWAVFDSCHSGTMLRSVSAIKWRKVNPSALGIPSPGAGRASRAKGQAGGSPASSAAKAPAPDGGESTGEPGGFVAFYAAQSHELAPELKMPPDTPSAAAHGLFTYQLAQAMMNGAGLTYREIGQMILQKYVTQGMRATTPLFEGTHLDTPLFGRKNRPAVLQWPVRIRGSRKRTLFVPAGQLQQIGPGAVFALLENASDGEDKAIGYAKAGHVELFAAELIPVAHGGKAAPDPARLPRSAYARLVKPAFRFTLDVAMPRLANATTSRERRVVRVIEKMAARRAGDSEIGERKNTGLQINWKQAGRDADIHLVFSPPPEMGKKGGSACRPNRLWFLDRTGALICEGRKANLSFRLQQPSRDFDRNVEEALRTWLNAIGKVRNLEQMVQRFRGGRFARKIRIRLMVKKGGKGEERLVDQSSRLPLNEGDSLRLEISNGSASPVDLTILLVDSRYGITTLFPTRGRTNRIAAGGMINNIGGRITADTLGLEGMIVIASKARAGTPVADFSFLAQKQLSRTKNVRALGGAGKGADGDGLEDLFASAAFGGRRSVLTRSATAKKVVKTPFKNVAIKSLRWMVDVQ